MKFVLNGCDISFVAEAGYSLDCEAEIIIGYDSIKRINDDVDCTIKGERSI